MSQNAIKGSQVISSPMAIKIANNVINTFKDKLNINACTLGSTGKKKYDDYSGDVDLAIELEMTDENIEKVKQFIIDNFSLNNKDIEFYIAKGLNILSFSYYYTQGLFDDIMTAQVDLMFSTNLEFTQFIYHSPNFRNNESNFKGLYRTNLLTYIAGRKPIEVPHIYDIYDDNGNLTDYWKYTLTYHKGLKLTHKTYKGKRGLLKNPVTVKEDNIYITMDPNEIVKSILGPNATIETTNSFESLVTYLFSKDYIYPKELPLIFEDFINDNRHEERISDVVQYIYDIVKKKVSKTDFNLELIKFCTTTYLNNLDTQ